MTQLKGCVALVTGAGKNIGRSIALGLADAGADVAVAVQNSIDAGRKVVSLIESKGQRAVLVQGDLAQRDDCRRIVAEVRKQLASPNILVNNAAIRPHKQLLELSEADVRLVMDTNLLGPLWMTQAVLPEMIDRNFGRIINIAGVDIYHMLPHRVPNIAAKAALAGMTRAVAHDYGKFGITVNAVAPGVIDTSRPQGNYPWLEEFLTRLNKENPIPGPGTTEEIAAACTFLASRESRYITGQTLHVNGGLSMHG